MKIKISDTQRAVQQRISDF